MDENGTPLYVNLSKQHADGTFSLFSFISAFIRGASVIKVEEYLSRIQQP